MWAKEGQETASNCIQHKQLSQNKKIKEKTKWKEKEDTTGNSIKKKKKKKSLCVFLYAFISFNFSPTNLRNKHTEKKKVSQKFMIAFSLKQNFQDCFYHSLNPLQAHTIRQRNRRWLKSNNEDQLLEY